MGMDLTAKGADVLRDPGTGAPRKIKGDFKLEGAPAGDRELLNLDKAAADADPVREMLETNARELMLPEGGGLSFVGERRTPQRRVLRYQEQLDGVPVFNGVVTVQVGSDNAVKQIDFGRLAAATAAAPEPPSDAPPLLADEALKAALKALGDPELRLDPAKPSKVWFPGKDGLRLAWRAEIATSDPHDWEVVVDAQSGELLHTRDMIKKIDGRGLVFDPNPVVTARDPSLRDPAATVENCGFAGSPLATIDAQRVERTLRDITLDDGVHRLVGPYAEIVEFGAPKARVPVEPLADGFRYSSADDRFLAVNVYYHVDTIQRYIQSLGIPDANNRRVRCDAYDNSNAAAWYSSIDKGLHFYDSGPCRPARAHDGECILHEYGHAVQDNQVPGWGQPNPVTGRDETGAMGEGFGDILACLFFSPLSDFGHEVFEDWIFGDQGGLRRVDGSKVYPNDWAGQVHADGEIWSGALWEIFQAIGGVGSADERRTARDDLLKALITSHVLVPANGTMTDGAEALLTAHEDVDPDGGKHLATMRMIFERRGLLPKPPAVAAADSSKSNGAAVF